MSLVRTLEYFVNHHQFIAHLVILAGVIIEGEFVIITTGILTHLKVLSVAETLTIVLFGTILKTFLGYEIGRMIRNRFPHNRILRYIEHKVHSFLPHFKRQPFWSIFISKFVYGVNNFTIIFSGFSRVRFRTYFLAEILSGVIWITLLFTLGYFFSKTAFSLSHDMRKVILIIFGMFLLFVFLQKIIEFVVSFFEDYNEAEENNV